MMLNEVTPINSILIQGVTMDDLERMVSRVVEQRINTIPANTSPHHETELFTRYETAKRLRVSLVTLHNWTKIGVITGRKVGNSVRYTQKDINDALKKMAR